MNKLIHSASRVNNAHLRKTFQCYSPQLLIRQAWNSPIKLFHLFGISNALRVLNHLARHCVHPSYKREVLISTYFTYYWLWFGTCQPFSQLSPKAWQSLQTIWNRRCDYLLIGIKPTWDCWMKACLMLLMLVAFYVPRGVNKVGHSLQNFSHGYLTQVKVNLLVIWYNPWLLLMQTIMWHMLMLFTEHSNACPWLFTEVLQRA